MDEQRRKPKSPAELLERHRKTFERFPAYDGRDGRLTPLEKTEALYANYVEAFDARGEQNADAKFKQWLSDDHGKALAQKQRASRNGSGSIEPDELLANLPKFDNPKAWRRPHGDPD